MFAKVAIVLAVFSAVRAGQEAPPPKVHTYNVPSVAKVSYPGPTVTKSVETYSAPSIEKTTTITRTITAPLNAPAGRQVAYAAPSPIIKAHAAGVYAAPAAIAAPIGYAAQPAPYAYAQPAPYAYAQAAPIGYAQPAYAAAPVGYAAAPVGYAAPIEAGPALGAVSAPGLALNSAPLGGAAFANQFASIYSAPSLGYAIGGQQQFLAAAPAYAAAPAPIAAAPVLAKAGYSN